METIRGNIIIACNENNKFKTLSKTQATQYMNFLKNASFSYKSIINTTFPPIKHTNINPNTNKNSEVLKMILDIQMIILNFIKKNN